MRIIRRIKYAWNFLFGRRFIFWLAGTVKYVESIKGKEKNGIDTNMSFWKRIGYARKILFSKLFRRYLTEIVEDSNRIITAKMRADVPPGEGANDAEMFIILYPDFVSI